MANQRKVIITCAVTGAIHMASMSPYLPVTANEIAILEALSLQVATPDDAREILKLKAATKWHSDSLPFPR